MDVIFFPNHLVWHKLHCAHILSLIMHCHTENVYCGFFSDCPCINFPDQEIDHQNSDTTPSIRFHIYHIIARCTAHGKIPLKKKKICYMCKQESSSYVSTKIYIIKELVMMETTISHFHTSFYITAIQKLAFQLPHVCILGTNHCG